MLLFVFSAKNKTKTTPRNNIWFKDLAFSESWSRVPGSLWYIMWFNSSQHSEWVPDPLSQSSCQHSWFTCSGFQQPFTTENVCHPPRAQETEKIPFAEWSLCFKQPMVKKMCLQKYSLGSRKLTWPLVLMATVFLAILNSRLRLSHRPRVFTKPKHPWGILDNYCVFNNPRPYNVSASPPTSTQAKDCQVSSKITVYDAA